MATPEQQFRTGTTTVGPPQAQPDLGAAYEELGRQYAPTPIRDLGTVSAAEAYLQATGAAPAPQAQQVRAQDFDRYVTRPVRTPYTPATPDRTLPTTSATTVEAPANLEAMRAATDEATASRTIATAAEQEFQQTRLQDQLLQAHAQRQQLQEQVQQREQEFQQVAAARDAAQKKALGMRQMVRSKQIDPGRLFRNAPWAAAAAIMADAMFALGGAGPQNTVGRMIETDTERQLMEIQKLGIDADNALADVAVEFDGDLTQAQAALNLAKADAMQNAMNEQAAALGLQQLPAQMLQQFAELDAWKAEQEAKLGQAATVRKQQNMRFEEGRAASGGGERDPTPAEMLKRAQEYNQFTEARNLATTGMTQEQRVAQEQAAGATPEMVEKYGDRMRAYEAADKVAERVQARFRDQIAKYGTVPGMQYGSDMLPVQVLRQVRAQLGEDAAQDALQNRQMLDQLGNIAMEAVKGAASEGDVERTLRGLKGSGTLDEKMLGIQALRQKTEDSKIAVGGSYSDAVRKQYERNRADYLRSQPDTPQPRGTAAGKLDPRQQELIDYLR